jgi:hypothetical protein
MSSSMACMLKFDGFSLENGLLGSRLVVIVFGNDLPCMKSSVLAV